MIRLAIVCLLAGCVADAVDGGPWEPADSITGELAPEFGPAPAPRDPPGCTLRVASWNVHFGGDPADLAAQIAASQQIVHADVIVTQEMEAYPDEPGSRAHRLADALGMTWIYAPSRRELSGTHGLAILSRYPLEAAELRHLAYIDRPTSPNHRIALAVEVVLGAQRVRVIDTHLDTRLSPGDRIRQVRGAATGLDDGALLGGDFNTQPWEWLEGLVPVTSTEAVVGQNHAQILDDYLTHLGWAGSIAPDTVTMRVPVFEMRLDNLYAHGYRILGGDVEHVEGSDHWPIWFDVDLCP